jgi:hypothetical protein
MEICKDKKLYKLFMWCLGLCEKATDKDYLRLKYKDQTNLCHFVRVICIYTPLILISTVLFYIMGISVIILPLILFPLYDTFIVLSVIVLIVISALLMVGIAYLFSDTGWFTKSEVFSVTSQYIKAKKEKICPYISFKRSE